MVWRDILRASEAQEAKQRKEYERVKQVNRTPKFIYVVELNISLDGLVQISRCRSELALVHVVLLSDKTSK